MLIAYTGELAIEMLETDSLPLLIVLDVKLPGMGGHEVLAAIRSNPRTRNVPVVMLTASRMEKDLDKAYERGANSYVVKPIGFDDFQEAINDIGLYWLVRNIPPSK